MKPVVLPLVVDTRGWDRGFKQARRSSEQFTDHTKRAGSAIKGAFAAFSATAVVLEMRNWVAAARDANRVAAQTSAVIKSTGGAAGLSAQGFSDLAKQVMKATAVDDDLVQGGENILATFNRIKAGGPERIFERATAAAVDMTAGLNQGVVSAEGLKSANLILGKALQEPIKGLSRLQRVGVSFDETQKQQIKRFVESGQVAKAQGVILTAVNEQFGGSAAAAVTPAKRLAVTWGNMQEVLGNLLIPAIDRAATVMTGVLEVIDRNRKAFGILFGVLAGGAGIIGTLVVAEKIHRAVVDATKVATEAWAAVQKGLNFILGITKVQAATTAIAEGELATATAASSAAAKGASTSYLAAAGKLGLFAAAAAAGAQQGTAQAKMFDENTKHSGLFGKQLDWLVQHTTIHIGKTKESTGATKDNAVALSELTPVQQQAAERTAAITQKTAELTGKLKELRAGFKAQTDSVRDAITGYDGLIAKSKVTTKEVIADIHNQVSNFKTYSKDVKRLIKAGVSPAAIEELSKKGPQFVHALATGSNRELKTYKGFWRDRQSEIKGSFAESMQRQYQGLVAKIKAMQKAINALKGKLVPVGVTGTIHWDKNAALLKSLTGNFSHKLPAFARGGLLGGYGGGDRRLIMAEDGEAIVPKHKARQPWFRQWAQAEGIPGFQSGGQVGAAPRKLVPPSSDALRYASRSALSGASSLHGRDAMSLFGGGLGGGSGAGGWRWQMAVLRSAFPGLQLISGFRPGARTHATGAVSYHALGRAVDVPPRMDVFNWIRGMFGKRTKELIFSPAGNRQVWNGQPHMYSGVTRADHWNHVHWAYGKGTRFVPRDGPAYLHRGEAVIPAAQNRAGGPMTRDEARMVAEELAKVIPTRIVVDDIVGGLLSKKGRTGGMKLGLD